jgi:hypothetical protein
MLINFVDSIDFHFKFLNLKQTYVDSSLFLWLVEHYSDRICNNDHQPY